MTILLTLAAATVALGSPAQWTHTTPVVHGNGQATATYSARPTVSMRQIGAASGARMSNERCVWTADINVERRLSQPGTDHAGVREMAAVKTLKGSRHGNCTTNRRLIDQEIAAKTPEINAHLLAVAERDQRELRSEIQTLAVPAGR